MAEDIQVRNVRKVKISARLSFTIYILETIGGLISFLIGPILRYNQIAETVFLLFFYVIQPGTFLINTSNTRDIITDEGYLNALRSNLGFLTIINQIESKPGEKYSNKKKAGARQRRSKAITEVGKRKTKNIGQIHVRKKQPGIFTISHNLVTPQVSQLATNSSNNVLDGKPCTSNAIHNLPNKRREDECKPMNLIDIENGDDDENDKHTSK